MSVHVQYMCDFLLEYFSSWELFVFMDIESIDTEGLLCINV